MKATTIILPPDGIVPIGIIQFVHGMAEHRKRYIETLDYFSQYGFICAIADLPGHGENIDKEEDIGYFGRHGMKHLIEETHDFTAFLKHEYPGLPVTLIGHSMGSLIVRAYAKKYDEEINTLIVCGSPSDNKLAGMGQMLIRFISIFKGWRYKSPFIANMVTGPFEKAFSNEYRKNSWLAANSAVADYYNKDPMCGFMFTLNGYYNLLSLIRTVYSKDHWKMRNPKLRIAFISGKEDPCKVNDKYFKDAVELMKSVGYTNVTSKLYQGMRHEIFNERNKVTVYEDILQIIAAQADDL
ncbi:MAG: alpha/beta fold hydrolase [Eubacterium sp.]